MVPEPEKCRIFCATANPLGVIVAETNQGKGVLGVIDGFPPKGIEGEADVVCGDPFCAGQR